MTAAHGELPGRMRAARTAAHGELPARMRAARTAAHGELPARMRAARVALAALALLVPWTAAAQQPGDDSGAPPPDASQPREGAPASQPRARDWDRYPRPDQSSGVAVTTNEASAAAAFARVVFFVPHLAIEVATAPVAGAVYVADRYHVAYHLQRFFFNEAGTFGIYPVVLFQGGFGFTGGARLTHTDLFGSGERLDVEATYGDQRRSVSADMDTGMRLGSRLLLSALGDFEVRPSQRFFGIGNLDEEDFEDVDAPLDPLTSDIAIASRFREREIIGGLGAHIGFTDNLALNLMSQYENKSFAEADSLRGDVDITRAYDVSRLPGFDEGVSQVYSEAELRLDSRRNATPFMTTAIPGAGLLAAARLGYTQPVDGGDGFFRYGAEGQYFFDLYRGTRLFGVRLLGEAVSKDRAEVPFINLPRLGGGYLLRGYDWDRFRDKTLALGSAEYWWQLNRYFSANLFVDTGRVAGTWSDFDLGGLRMGYGAGLTFHTRHWFLANAQVASSIDGGVFFNLAFDPVIDARVRRY